VASTAGLFCLVFGVSQVRKYGLDSFLVPGLLGSGLFFLVVFVFIERKVAHPIVDLSLFHDRVFSNAAAVLFLIFVAVPSHVLIMPFYLMKGILLTASEAGLLLAVYSVTAMVFGPISGWLSDRFGPFRFAILGHSRRCSSDCQFVSYAIF
jgi:hypothetical protein